MSGFLILRKMVIITVDGNCDVVLSYFRYKSAEITKSSKLIQ